MLDRAAKAVRAAWQRSPSENWADLRQRLGGERSNRVMPDWCADPASRRLLAARVEALGEPVVLLGGDEAEALESMLDAAKHPIVAASWNWRDPPDSREIPGDVRIVLCRVPSNAAQWREVRTWKSCYPGRVIGIQELVLPMTLLALSRERLGYYSCDDIELVDHYLGRRRLGGLDLLADRVRLAGASVVEFGPLDGCQTAGLVALGARTVTCIEARAENALKTLIARQMLGWSNVRIVMDDFHNADADRYGRFDLVVAHGVYYHSVAPFLFLENLLSLSDQIFVGGFCASEALPVGDWVSLEHEGRAYRAKAYRESGSFTAGVNPHGYFFRADDLMRFFAERDCEVEILSDETCGATAGSYLRFLATRRGVAAG